MIKINWNKNWYKKYESLYSIFMKLIIANSLSDYEFIMLFKKKVYRDADSFVNNYKLFKTKNLREVLEEDIININNGIVNKFQGILPYFFTKDIISSNFVFCKSCLEESYHSVLHQIIYVKKCPFHMSHMSDRCPKCRKIQIYKINYNMFPFQCRCGYTYYKKKTYIEISKDWTKDNSINIKDNSVKRIVNLTKKEFEYLKSIQIYDFNNKYHQDIVYNIVLSTLDKKFLKDIDFSYNSYKYKGSKVLINKNISKLSILENLKSRISILFSDVLKDIKCEFSLIDFKRYNIDEKYITNDWNTFSNSMFSLILINYNFMEASRYTNNIDAYKSELNDIMCVLIGDFRKYYNNLDYQNYDEFFWILSRVIRIIVVQPIKIFREYLSTTNNYKKHQLIPLDFIPIIGIKFKFKDIDKKIEVVYWKKNFLNSKEFNTLGGI
jgi:hypothetical protein